MPDAAHPRGRETSNALVEVRTVLSRAETARATLDPATEWRAGRTGDGVYVVERWHDPDAADMRAALDDVIARLDRWRRTGRPRRG